MDATYLTPTVTWKRFASATIARNATAARCATTGGAWRDHGDSAFVVYHAAAAGGLRFAASGPAWLSDNRAVLPVAIEAPGRSIRLFALLERHDPSWGVSAAASDERHASLFLEGVLPAIFEVSDLGPSPEAERWARARYDQARPEVTILGTHALPRRNRAVVRLARSLEGPARSVEEWVCLDTRDGAPRVIGRGNYPGLNLLLTGIRSTLPARRDPLSAIKDKVPSTAESAPAAG